MPLLPIQIPPGVVRNATPYDTPGTWWDTNLIRWQGGTMQPIAGWERVTKTPFAKPLTDVLNWRRNDNRRMIVVATPDTLYVDADGAWTDITPTGFQAPGGAGTSGAGFGIADYGEEAYGTARSAISLLYAPLQFWTMDNWGQDLILTASSDGFLYYYSSSTPSTKPTKITTAPGSHKAVLVTPERHVLALGVAGNPRRLGWSSREDYADWNFTSTTNTAGYLDVESDTALLTAAKVREGTLVFSESDVFLSRYIGQPFIYSSEFVAQTSLISPKAVATFDGRAAWLDGKGFQVFQNGTLSPLQCPFVDDVLSDINLLTAPLQVAASHNGTHPELWWFYPSADSAVNDRYVIWNYAENWWARGALGRSAMCPAGPEKTPYMAGTDGHLYRHEVGWLAAGEPRTGTIYAESSALLLGSGDRNLEIKQMLPASGHGYDSLSVQFFTQQTPLGAERTFGPYSPRADGYTDVRVTGRGARMRIEATKDGDWNIGAVRLDVAPGAAR